MFKVYFNNIVYYLGGIGVVLFFTSFFVEPLYDVALLLLLSLLCAVVIDFVLLNSKKKAMSARRVLPDRMSLNDENTVVLYIRNDYAFKAALRIVDELPDIFQQRSWERKLLVQPGEEASLTYLLKPASRGSYVFHDINIFVKGPLGLAVKYFKIDAEAIVKVYPSFLQLKKYQLSGIANQVAAVGSRKIRRIGSSTEFEQIKEYVRGDDYRTINWKASARKGDLMVNNYVDEKSQQVYCIINKGRLMKMPFDGMTLLDYAINASLVLSNVAIHKQDKAGLICFADKTDTTIVADRRAGQMNVILETLYNTTTDFLEADYESLYGVVRNKITNRSLLVLFTNFESLEGLYRELPALKRMAHYHLLVVVFFENTAIKSLLEIPADNVENVYVKTIAEKFAFEKKQMVKILQQHGILSILTVPEKLTVNIINKYLDLKNKAMI